MGALDLHLERFDTVCCCTCGVTFAMPHALQDNLKNSHRNFWCPNGHQQHFVDQTDAEKLRDELAKEKQRREMAEREAKMEAQRATQANNEVERLKKRARNGVCPCCKRSFQNLRRHMQAKHPEPKP